MDAFALNVAVTGSKVRPAQFAAAQRSSASPLQRQRLAAASSSSTFFQGEAAPASQFTTRRFSVAKAARPAKQAGVARVVVEAKVADPKKVAVIMGGRTLEWEVSMRTGTGVMKTLKEMGHVAQRFQLNADGTSAWEDADGNVLGKGEDYAACLVAIKKWSPDCAFIAMHGADGEDGRLQGALDLLDIPYQGSGVAGSAVGMDKGLAKRVAQASGVRVAQDFTLRAGSTTPDDLKKAGAALGYPLMLKLAKSGSSVGVEPCKNEQVLLEKALGYLNGGEEYVLLEKYLPGREFTVPVVEDENGVPRGFPIVEIKTKAEGEWFDYVAKYTAGAVEEVCPADIPESLRDELHEIAIAFHVALGCKTYSRTDVKLDVNGVPHALEINTLPGLTPTSLMPQSAKAAGLGYDGLLQRCIDLAIKKHADAKAAIQPTVPEL
eukprot:tig00000881_g5235.t1